MFLFLLKVSLTKATKMTSICFPLFSLYLGFFFLLCISIDLLSFLSFHIFRLFSNFHSPPFSQSFFFSPLLLVKKQHVIFLSVSPFPTILHLTFTHLLSQVFLDQNKSRWPKSHLLFSRNEKQSFSLFFSSPCHLHHIIPTHKESDIPLFFSWPLPLWISPQGDDSKSTQFLLFWMNLERSA